MMDHDHETVETLGAAAVSGRPLSTMQRRRFLQAALAVGAGAVVGPALTPASAQAQASGTNTIVLTVTLDGGNDGLNTLGPFSSGAYRDLRGALSIAEGSAHSGPDNLSWHPSLRRLATRYRRGDVAVVRGVGDPGRDLSHFSNMARWQSGNPNGAISATGWLGRWLDTADSGQFAGVSIGGQGVPLHLRGNQAEVTDLPNRGGTALYGSDRSQAWDVSMYRAINQMRRADTSPWANAVGEVGAQSVAAARDVAGAYQTELPDASRLQTDMVLAARVINLNLGTRIVNVVQRGYDTHDNQIGANSGVGTHADLLGDLDLALDTFFSTLSGSMAERVVVVLYSEFGRRAEANGSRGTDHGTSNHLFAVGRRVTGGLYGEAPPLGSLDDRGNFAVTTDFRNVYATVVDQALGGDTARVLGQNYGTVSGLLVPEAAPSTVADRVAEIRGRRRRNAEDYFLDRAPTF